MIKLENGSLLNPNHVVRAYQRPDGVYIIETTSDTITITKSDFERLCRSI